MTHRILVVDDDALNREILDAFLSMSGYEVQLAHDGATALELLNKQVIQLIITDIRMPNMDGFQLVTHLRQQETTRTMPIIIVSGFDDAESRAESQRVGATDFVARPLDLRTFIAKIQQLLGA